MDDLDALYARASAAGAQVVKALNTEPWGMREFGLRTVDGHRIMFGQEVGAA
ncbi:VOC family protein [Caenimonas terrae]|uniref:VOC family protein n=1 Tax=Caenimonas terrae TaxID=696074 RepID=A0ABW0NF82_9BURK